MKSNRVRNSPPIIENLGDGTSYYNFDVVQSVRDDGGEEIDNFDYDQVTVPHPITYSGIIEALTVEGYYVTGQKTRFQNMVKADCQALSLPTN